MKTPKKDFWYRIAAYAGLLGIFVYLAIYTGSHLTNPPKAVAATIAKPAPKVTPPPIDIVRVMAPCNQSTRHWEGKTLYWECPNGDIYSVALQ
jgi:uncharacterized membrane protein YagU involved in acid resistance